MFALFKLAIRNLSRHKRRSILTGFMIGIAALTMVLAFAFSQSVAKRMTEAITRGYTGNIQVHAPTKAKIEILAPSDEIPLLTSAGRVQELVMESKLAAAAAPRLRFMGLLSKGEDSKGTMLTAIDPDLEPKVTSKLKILEGTYLTDDYGILLGKMMAKATEAHVGDEFVLMVSNQDGYLNGFPFKVQGIVTHEGMGMFLDHMSYININTARQLLYLNDSEAFEIAVALKQGVNEKDAIAELQNKLNGSGISLQVASWRNVAGIINGIIMGMKVMPQIMMAILFLVVAFGMLNTILMSVLERTREIGTMMALGTKCKEVQRLFLLETGILSTISAGLGCLIGAGVIYWLSRTGVPALVEALEFGFGGKRLYFIFDWSGIIFSFMLTITLSIMVTFFPTRRITRLKPVDALRQN